jgi:hypothetical protein
MTYEWFHPSPPQGEGAENGQQPWRTWMWGVPKVRLAVGHVAIVR